jgi:hypothetical protein
VSKVLNLAAALSLLLRQYKHEGFLNTPLTSIFKRKRSFSSILDTVSVRMPVDRSYTALFSLCILRSVPRPHVCPAGSGSRGFDIFNMDLSCSLILVSFLNQNICSVFLYVLFVFVVFYCFCFSAYLYLDFQLLSRKLISELYRTELLFLRLVAGSASVSGTVIGATPSFTFSNSFCFFVYNISISCCRNVDYKLVSFLSGSLLSRELYISVP